MNYYMHVEKKMVHTTKSALNEFTVLKIGSDSGTYRDNIVDSRILACDVSLFKSILFILLAWNAAVRLNLRNLASSRRETLWPRDTLFR